MWADFGAGRSRLASSENNSHYQPAFTALVHFARPLGGPSVLLADFAGGSCLIRWSPYELFANQVPHLKSVEDIMQLFRFLALPCVCQPTGPVQHQKVDHRLFATLDPVVALPTFRTPLRRGRRN